MALLTIITVNYNSGKKFSQTFASLKKFIKDDRIEFVVVDGDSVDSSRSDIVDVIHDIDVLIMERDNGIYHAMNKGLAASIGEWVWFVNSGDIPVVDPHYLIEALSSTSAQLLFSNLMTVDGVILQDFTLPFLARSAINHQNMICKRLLLVDGFDERYKYCADYNLIINHFYTIKAEKLNLTLCLYDLEGGSSVVSRSRRLTIWRERILIQWRSSLPSRIRFLLVFFSCFIILLKFIYPRFGSVSKQSVIPPQVRGDQK